ncbi:MAG TPA: hypothetical protein PK668_23145 [Myxococcota bacterium]|nr:hypothetical protein [Myxococcota bacterium]HRY95592.1 hypothetical protein [Myxococcota bacterium]HSA20869.1 hypothetical protein [Myxococcota bacterium]
MKRALLGMLLASMLSGCSESTPADLNCATDLECEQRLGPTYFCHPLTNHCRTGCRPICEEKACGQDACGGSCGTCPTPEVCNPTGQCEWPAGVGEACGAGAAEGAPSLCADWLRCLEVSFETGALPCSADGDCLAFYPPDWNPICLHGDCLASLCAWECSRENGTDWCPGGLDPLRSDLGPDYPCLCVPVESPGEQPPGSACRLGPINPTAGACQQGTWCLGSLGPELYACSSREECRSWLPGGVGADCVAGRCTWAFCASPCDSECLAWQLSESLPCMCGGSQVGPRVPGEPCALGAIHAISGGCLPGLLCVGERPGAGGLSCPQGDGECRWSSEAGWNPTCAGGLCGWSVCVEICRDGACPDGMALFDFSGFGLACLCLPGPTACDSVLPGGPCAFEGAVHPEAGDCPCGFTCLGALPNPQGPSCSDDSFCALGLDPLLNPVCLDGHCGYSYCAAPCDEGACRSGFEPSAIHGGCFCVPRQ